RRQGPSAETIPKANAGGIGRAIDRLRRRHAPVPLLAFGLEPAAVLHLALVDVHRHRDGVVAAVVDRVVLVRRDQAAGAAGAGMHAAGGAEAAALAVGLQQFVLGDLQLAVPDAFHAPQAAVVVDRRALAGAPGHGDHAVAEVGAAVDLPAGV